MWLSLVSDYRLNRLLILATASGVACSSTAYSFLDISLTTIFLNP